ncbi:hypothetical protein B0H13DRAFT_2670296 [Mycena leptocephala]|nr:hypothetical protein B0H13DRAFT_2670296 [Mycena leptocephala]
MTPALAIVRAAAPLPPPHRRRSRPSFRTRLIGALPTVYLNHLYRIPRGLGDHTLRIPVSPLPIFIDMSPSRIIVPMGSDTTRGATRSHAPPTLPHLLQTLFPCPSAPSPSATLHLFACVMASPASVSAAIRGEISYRGPLWRLYIPIDIYS